jgi:hypothetical protein
MSDQWEAKEIQEKLRENDLWVMRGLLAIYARQTEDEKNAEVTKHHNRVGFSGADATLLSSFAKQIQKRGSLSVKQMLWARKKMLKYAGQLAKIANGE